MAKELRYIWNEAKEINFEVFKITGSFNTKSSFSSLDLIWERYYKQGYLAVKCQYLFNFNPDELPEGIEDTSQYITSGCKLVQWPPSIPFRSEEDCLLALHKNLLTPLCRADEVIVEKKKKFGDAGIRANHIGMGSSNTWHGSPDARVRGCELVLMKTGCDDDDEYDDDDDDEEEGSCSSSDSETTLVSSDRVTTNIEVKKRAKFEDNFSQLVSTCVVSSFTEHHVHPSKNTMVPTILIDQSVIRVCLYDCINDILLVSQPRLLSHKNTRLSTTAVFLTWLVINHR